MYAATRGPNVKWGHRFQMGAEHHWLPRWRRPWLTSPMWMAGKRNYHLLPRCY